MRRAARGSDQTVEIAESGCLTPCDRMAGYGGRRHSRLHEYKIQRLSVGAHVSTARAAVLWRGRKKRKDIFNELHQA